MNNYYEFRQNNSGGSFIVDNNLAEFVFVEAPNADMANYLAENIGVYFDGVDNEYDCPCCGDRWTRADEDDVVSQQTIDYLRTDKYVAEYGLRIVGLNGNITSNGNECLRLMESLLKAQEER